MAGLVHVAADYHKQAITLPSEVESSSSMASSRNEVRTSTGQNEKIRIPMTIFAALSFFLLLPFLILQFLVQQANLRKEVAYNLHSLRTYCTI